VTAAEVTQALAAFEQRLRDLGAPVVERLRPGLTRPEVEHAASEFGVVLSEDATAWWMWHDGDRLRYEDDWGRPSLTPTGVFCGLRAALERSQQAHDTTWGQDVDPARPDLDWRFHREWVALVQGTTPLVVDCREPAAPESPTGVWAADGGLGHTITLAERIGWWHWALDHRHWVPRPDGTWLVDDARSPSRLVGLHARDNAG
jgi:hypothetical protein